MFDKPPSLSKNYFYKRNSKTVNVLENNNIFDMKKELNRK